MAQFFTVLTQTGQAKMANAIALGTMIEITQLAVGDGGGSLPQPDSSRETLINEVRRAPINRVEVDADNPNWLVVEQILPPDVGGWTIREVGIFDTDGDLIGYGNYPETYKPTLDEGSGRTQTIRMVLEVSHTSAVTLRVDPSVVLATREYVDSEIDKHEQSRNHPAATETSQGMLEIANDEEALAGTDDARAMTPVKVHAAFNQYGIGKPADLEVIDLNTLSTPGIYAAAFGSQNSPYPQGAVNVIVSGYAEDRVKQVALPIVSDGKDHVYFRQKYGSVWSGWKEILTEDSFASDEDSVSGSSGMLALTPRGARLAFEQFGLGRGWFEGTANLDALVNQGFYFINGDTEGLPLPVSGSLTVTGQNSRPGQIFMPSEEGRVFTRSRYEDGGGNFWTDWRELTIEGNVASASEAQSFSGLDKILTPGRLADALKGGNQSLGTTGFQVLPGGLILQWGAVSVSQSPDSVNAQSVTASLPVSFPNDGIAGFAQVSDVGSLYDDFANGRRPSRNSISIQYNVANASGTTLTYFAIGY
ncbi:phage tail-collar fiber domain-containing protein [Parasedimentitalea maritima]|uniref:Phage tail-collar fibre protein n=1 Tax=Parasedimentitalea maritima TaxID=2578117 RepID=A0A6A4RC06_9RHOB|nr:phage tail protein [Zongyanglinia marina]KAE9624493.1 hypothetical protein GP644_23355 [Zongyanglinia marina]